MPLRSVVLDFETGSLVGIYPDREEILKPKLIDEQWHLVCPMGNLKLTLPFESQSEMTAHAAGLLAVMLTALSNRPAAA